MERSLEVGDGEVHGVAESDTTEHKRISYEENLHYHKANTNYSFNPNVVSGELGTGWRTTVSGDLWLLKMNLIITI